MSHTPTVQMHRAPAPPVDLAERSAAELVAIRRRRRLPWLVAVMLGVLALVLAVLLLAPTASGLSEKLAQVCTAAGPNVPADATSDCQRAQRGEIPVDANGVPGFDGRTSDTAVTVPAAIPGAPVTIFPAGPAPATVTVPGAVVPGPVVTVPGPAGVPTTITVPAEPVVPATVTVVPPTETVTLAAPPPETVTLAAPPPETVTEQPLPSTSTTTETVTVVVPAPADPGSTTQPPEVTTTGAPPPVTTSGDPFPAASTQPVEVLPAIPAPPDGDDELGTLEWLLGLGLGM